jgi:hypothetical protein
MDAVEVVEAALRTLRTLTRVNASVLLLATSTTGVSVILQALHRYVLSIPVDSAGIDCATSTRNLKVAECAVAVLVNMTSGLGGSSFMDDAQAVACMDIAIASLNICSDAIDVARVGCYFFRYFGSNRQALIVQRGGLSVLLAMLRHHIAVSDFVLEALQTLRQLFCRQDACNAVLTMGGVSTILTAVHQHAQLSSVASAGKLVFASVASAGKLVFDVFVQEYSTLNACDFPHLRYQDSVSCSH